MPTYVQLSCVVVDGDESGRQEMVAFLANQGVHVLAQLAEAGQLAPFLGHAEAPQMVVVNLDPSPMETLRKLTPMVRQHASTSFFVLSQVIDPNLLMEAMQIGVTQFVPLPIVAERFVAGIERVAEVHGMGKHARVVQVISSVGGCGATTVACNVAATLAKSGKTVLLDLDLVRGTVASAFDVRPRYTIADLMDLSERLDRQVLDNALVLHGPTAVAILSRPEMPEETQRVTQPGLNRLLSVLSRAFEYVVVDSVMSVDPVHTVVNQAADFHVIVVQLTVPSVRNTERYIGTLKRLGVDPGKIKVIVNRFVKKGYDIEPAQVERALGMKISWTIPNDFRNAMGAINYGQPVVLRAPRAEISASLCGLAKSLNGRVAAETDKVRR
ncbi:MAG: AAA family ATPase [Bacillota bacterium]